MLRGDVKAWLQASGWKFVPKGKHWVKGVLVLEVESSKTDPDVVSWVLRGGSGVYVWSSKRGVTETLYETLNKFD